MLRIVTFVLLFIALAASINPHVIGIKPKKVGGYPPCCGQPNDCETCDPFCNGCQNFREDWRKTFWNQKDYLEVVGGYPSCCNSPNPCETCDPFCGGCNAFRKEIEQKVVQGYPPCCGSCCDPACSNCKA
mmetsp:Transcript_18527/g.20600  ORF Transcript_18527/g.20600 Transcript_18527/m.20600 type:complete len:130 (-) Transcript_18527:43-432(-)